MKKKNVSQSFSGADALKGLMREDAAKQEQEDIIMEDEKKKEDKNSLKSGELDNTSEKSMEKDAAPADPSKTSKSGENLNR